MRDWGVGVGGGDETKARRPSPGGAVMRERTKHLLSNDLSVAGEGYAVVRPLSLCAGM